MSVRQHGREPAVLLSPHAEDVSRDGEVYVCRQTGNVHICTDTLCTRQITLPRSEGIECELTHRNYGVPIVYYEEQEHDSDITYNTVKDRHNSIYYNRTTRSGGGGGGSGTKRRKRDGNAHPMDLQTCYASDRVRIANVESRLSATGSVTKPVHAIVHETCHVLLYDERYEEVCGTSWRRRRYKPTTRSGHTIANANVSASSEIGCT